VVKSKKQYSGGTEGSSDWPGITGSEKGREESQDRIDTRKGGERFTVELPWGAFVLSLGLG